MALPLLLSVCSGIGGAELVFDGLAKPIAMAEIASFPRKVLKARFPEIPLHSDFVPLIADPPLADILSGGTPCQAWSYAGKRLSLEDARGNLTLAFAMLFDAIDERRRRVGRTPGVCLWENVPGVLSTKDNAFGCFLGALVGHGDALQPPGGKKWGNAGVVHGPRRKAAWRVLDAQWFGVAQRRKRVFVIASARDGFDPVEILFECQGVQRHTTPSRKKGEGVTHDTSPSLVASGRGVERCVDTRGQDPVVAVAFGGNNTSGPIDVSTALTAHGGPHGRCDFASETFVAQPCVTGDVSHALRADGFDASEDGTGRGTGRGTPIVPATFSIQAGETRENPLSGPDGMGVQSDIAYTLEARSEVQAVAFLCKDHGADAGEISPTMRTMGHAGSHPNAGGQLAVAFQSSQSEVRTSEVHATLDANNGSRRHNGVVGYTSVRRLMPIECERLQGLPDNWTNVPDGRGTAADGPRYKAIGNGWAIPCVRWVAERLCKHLYNG